MKTARCFLSGVQVALFVLLSLSFCVGQTAGRQTIESTTEPLPEVISAAVPFYPKMARAARISGSVRLHITTDGKRVSAITDQTGPAMLIPAAEENVRSWSFVEHIPTAFDVTFQYKLLDVSKCVTGNEPVSLHFPAEVEINSTTPYCDTARFFRNQKIFVEQHAYAVELHISMNGSEVSNPPEVEIANSMQSFRLPVKSGIFLVPEAMRHGSDLMFKARVGKDQIEIRGIGAGFLEQGWNISLKETSIACVISFDPLDGDGIEMSVTPCRVQANK